MINDLKMEVQRKMQNKSFQVPIMLSIHEINYVGT